MVCLIFVQGLSDQTVASEHTFDQRWGRRVKRNEMAALALSSTAQFRLALSNNSGTELVPVTTRWVYDNPTDRALGLTPATSI